jgi:cob(I)alamin adenosyltransferase
MTANPNLCIKATSSNCVELHNPQFDKQGFIQVYTGYGKGKTTASIGLIIRAIGHGWNVCLLQFMKGERVWPYGEIQAFKKKLTCPQQLYVGQYGANKIGFYDDNDLKSIRKGWLLAKHILTKPTGIDLLVLDEITHCLNAKIISSLSLTELLVSKPKSLEVVITGRDAPKKIIDVADLVTNMYLIKHYYQRGVTAREGIEY